MEEPASRDRYWVSVHYRCCNVYQRVYFPRGSHFATGRCPRCLREVSFQLTEEGEHGRFFTAEEEV